MAERHVFRLGPKMCEGEIPSGERGNFESTLGGSCLWCGSSCQIMMAYGCKGKEGVGVYKKGYSTKKGGGGLFFVR